MERDEIDRIKRLYDFVRLDKAEVMALCDLALKGLSAEQPAKEAVALYLGHEYRTLGGELVKLIGIESPGRYHETMYDERGIHRYSRRPHDIGRVTGCDIGYDGNLVFPSADPRPSEQTCSDNTCKFYLQAKDEECSCTFRPSERRVAQFDEWNLHRDDGSIDISSEDRRKPRAAQQEGRLVCSTCKRPVDHIRLGEMSCGNCGPRSFGQVVSEVPAVAALPQDHSEARRKAWEDASHQALFPAERTAATQEAAPKDEWAWDAERCIAWLDQKYKRHGEEGDYQSAKLMRELSAAPREAQAVAGWKGADRLLSELADVHRGWCNYCHGDKAICNGSPACSLRDYLSATPAPGQWVSVGERLPNEGVYVLAVWNKFDAGHAESNYAVSCWNGNYWQDDEGDDYRDPTHWQPLPASPATPEPREPRK